MPAHNKMVNQTEEACFRRPGIIRVAMPDRVFTSKSTAIPCTVNHASALRIAARIEIRTNFRL